MGKKPMASGDEITEILRDAIVSGEYKPRERLIETELSERYKVSRTPIREAIHNLAAVGLVKLEPYKGAIVADVDAKAIKEIYEVRINLEGLATQLAVSRFPDSAIDRMRELCEQMEQCAEEKDYLTFGDCNEAFHHVIYEYCGNETLIGIIDDLLRRSRIFRHSAWRSGRNLRKTIQGHRDMLKAILARDVEKAKQATEQHIRIYLAQSLEE